MRALIDRLYTERTLGKEDFCSLLSRCTPEDSEYLFKLARGVSGKYFGNRIYVRGLIEFTNYCRNDCYYCGIRRGNHSAERYRLTRAEILSCCESGYGLGFRTFVLQGGEDPFFTDEDIAELVRTIKKSYPDCAVTLSIGEKNADAYRKFFQAGADRYLLRHETANAQHYGRLHPPGQNLQNRMKCLRTLKEIGYQVGTGFMVGSPFQTVENLAEDLLFIRQLEPQMVGIGPYIPHHDTPFAGQPAGSMERTLLLIGTLRLMLPNALIPATTALGTIHPNGREKGILAGANVVMPNLSPVSVRKKYELYDNKICTGEEAAECRFCLQSRMESIGYRIVVDRGDFLPVKKFENAVRSFYDV